MTNSALTTDELALKHGFKENGAPRTIVDVPLDLPTTGVNTDTVRPRIWQQVGCSRELLILAVILAVLQVADGVLTAVGVMSLGIDMEANPLLRSMMGVFGVSATLFAVKGFSIAVIAFLTTLGGLVPWLTIAFRAMVALYSVCAVIPWSIMLFA